MTDAETAQLAINTIRALSVDAVQAANSGHPGAPMALAPIAYTSGTRSCGLTRKIRFGQTATASSFRMAMPRC